MAKSLYQKIYADLIAKIRSGALQTGETLPATRELAELHRCHRFTVMRVAQDLIAEGWIEASERSRYKVSAKAPLIETRSAPGKKQFHSLLKQTKKIPVFDLETTRYPIEFWGGQPDLRLFPKDEFRRVLSAALKRTKPDHLSYGLTKGLPGCLKEVGDYLRQSRQLMNKECIITNGSQEALFLICQTFINAGDRIAVERKGYPPAWRLFESLGAQLVPIEVDEEGLQTDDLEEKIKQKKIKMIYVTPLHQYPTTVALSPRRRQHLIRLAEKFKIPILEDDYDHEFHYTGPPPAPLATETDFSIYVCSFSKILFPGARLGVVACNAEILKKICYQKLLVSRQTDCLAQIGLSAWIKDGGFEKHLRRMRRTYQERYFFMRQCLEKIRTTQKITWVSPSGGMSIWVNLHQNSKLLSDAAKKKGILFQHEQSMDYVKNQGSHLRIGFACVDESHIQQGFQVLESLLKK